jgi:hypothetical protein
MEQIVSSPNFPKDGALASELLTEFQRGYSLEKLRPLLSSNNEELVSLGVWIASELGEKGSPLLKDVSPLLKHPTKRVRFFAIDCILLWAGESNGPELAAAVQLLDDPERAVRKMAMNFLASASYSQIGAALSHLKATEPSSSHTQGLQWLLNDSNISSDDIISKLNSEGRLVRRYGVIAAVRMLAKDKRPLLHAASIDDPEISEFANERK